MAAAYDRAARAETLEGFFRLQLMLVAAMRARTGAPLGDSVLHLTNFHRRFGLGDAGAAPRSPFWEHYLDRLGAASCLEAQVACTKAAFVRAPPEPPGHLKFGCFSHDPPDESGSVRIHFSPGDDENDGAGPLARARLEQRVEELRRMFGAVRIAHPQAKTVRGASWLYNLEAYRRLFPPQYGAARTQPPRVRMNGMSSWGQLIDHRGAIKRDVAAAFLRNLDAELDPAAPWLVFPLRALVTSAPIETFYRFYGLA
jgi:hypothetical protein